MKPREYQWDAEEPLSDLAVRVTAHVWGRDTPARGPSYASGGSPAEPREVEITVERNVSPILGEHEWQDITDINYTSEDLPRWVAWLDELCDLACEKDDDADDEARERYSENRGGER